MTQGVAPATLGPALADGTWLIGLAQGLNRGVAFGVTAHAGGGQAAAQAMPTTSELTQVDTVATASDSIALPFAVAGTIDFVFNNGANTLAVFAQSGTNLLTGATDTINQLANATSFTLTAGQSAVFFCCKNGKWAAIKTA